MKHLKYLFGAFVLGMIIFSCGKKFLDIPVSGGVAESQVANRKGVEALLIGAYAMLDGVTGTDQRWFKGGATSNWVFGSICGSEAYKGSYPGDQADITPLELFTPVATNSYIDQKWGAAYTGVYRTNDVLRIMKMAPDITADDKNEIEAEARFLRAFYHFEAKKMWNKVPFVDETITFSKDNYFLGNDKNIWSDIANDLRFAIDNLPKTQKEVGRANKYTAMALLAKAYLFQDSFYHAKSLLDIIINSGRYSLLNKYADNFNPETKNSSESVFACQTSVNDGAGGMNGNFGDNLNYPNYGPGGGCCGFFQPSQYLVNHFKIDSNGLPDLDHFNDTPVTSDDGIASADSFTPYTGKLDPRLDWTVGRRGIPFLDWGNHTGQDWIRDQFDYGPYSPKKNTYYKSQEGTLSDASGWPVGNANNVSLIRYADVILWAAEAEVELEHLDKAEEYVNMIRNRMHDHNGWVHKYLDDSNPAAGFYTDDGHLAANYFINPYPDGDFTAKGKDYARKAVQFERMLELGMEGHRFFDLVRWGIADQEIKEYFHTEQTYRTYFIGAVFQKDKNEYFPIPQSEIDKTGGILKQNPGY